MLKPPDLSLSEISLSLMYQPLAQAVTFSVVCVFSGTNTFSLPWLLLHFEVHLVTLLRSLVLTFGFLCGFLTVDCSFFSGFVPVLSSANILASCVLKDLSQFHMFWEYLLADLFKRDGMHAGWDRKYILSLIVAHGIVLLGDVPKDLASFGSTFVSSSGTYVVLVRFLTAVCSLLMISILALGVAFLYFSSWWQVDEKLIVIFSPKNMIVAGPDFPFVSYLEQSSYPLFPLIWSELDEQASLVLQGSSSHRMLSTASGAVCVVLWITLDAISQEACETVVIRFLMVSLCDMYRHSILYVTSFLVCLAFISLFVLYLDGV